MNILFVMEHRANAGNTHAIVNYMRVGRSLGHRIALHGAPRADLPGVDFSTEVREFDRVVYLFESQIYRVKRLSEVTQLGRVPRAHRFVLDADAKYRPTLVLDGYDRNHFNETERAIWAQYYDALSDRILKPSLAPPDGDNVTTLPFFGFNPEIVIPPDRAPRKRYDVLYVGHNWWRWKEMKDEILPAIAQIRDQLGEICFAGLWWDGGPIECVTNPDLEPAFRVEKEAFRKLRIGVAPAVPYTDVIRTMSTGRVNIFTQRPVLRHLRHLTLRYFEEICADTVPLLMLDTDLAVAVYGPAARELVLPGRIAEKLLDALRRPDHYRGVVEDVRRHVLAHHPYERRVEELVSALRG